MPEPFKCFFQIANAKGSNVYIKGNKCYRCNHEWVSSGDETPRVCPKCKSPYWDRPRRKEYDPEEEEVKKVIDELSVSFEKVLASGGMNMSDESTLYEVQKLLGKLSPEEQRLLKKKFLGDGQ